MADAKEFRDTGKPTTRGMVVVVNDPRKGALRVKITHEVERMTPAHFAALDKIREAVTEYFMVGAGGDA